MPAVDKAVQLVFDTNILVDALLARGHYYQYAVRLLEAVRSGEVEGWYAPHSVTTVYYLVERTLARETSSRKETVSIAQALVKKFMGILKPLPQVGDELLHLNGKPGDDLEDLLIVKLATGYLPNPLIVTRDKHFLHNRTCQAAHPKEIVESGLAPWLSDQKNPVQFIDLAAQQRLLRPKIQAGFHRVLHHGQYIMGPEVGKLEEKLAEFVGVNHCITCSSGTDALLMALMALDIGPGDEVITVPYTWISTAEVIALLRAKPVFVDILPDTFNMDPGKLASAITPRTKAIMPVGIYGQCADMSRINAIANNHNIPVIEDAAQCFGATHHGKKSCNLSLIGCTSFFPSKPLGCYGDGGAIFTPDDTLADKMRQIRIHGQKVKHQHPLVGINGRLDTMQAAILLEKFSLFPEECELRAQAGKRYSELLSDIPGIKTPVIAHGNTSVYAQYTILSENRDRLSQTLKENDVPSVAYYTAPLHLQGAFADLGHKPGDFPVAEKVAAQCLSLPMSPYLKQADQEKVVKAIAHNP